MSKVPKITFVCNVSLALLFVVGFTCCGRVNPKSIAANVPLNDLLKHIYRDPIYPVQDIIWRAKDKIAIRLNCKWAPLSYFDTTYHLHERSDIDGVSIVSSGDVEIASFSKRAEQLLKSFDSLRCSGNICLSLIDTISEIYRGSHIDYRKLVVQGVSESFVFVSQYIAVTNSNGTKNWREIESYVNLDGRIGVFYNWDWSDSSRSFY